MSLTIDHSKLNFFVFLPFKIRTSKRSESGWRLVFRVRFSSPHCILVFRSSLYIFTDEDEHDDLFSFPNDVGDKKRKRQADIDENNASKRACVGDIANKSDNATKDTLKLEASDAAVFRKPSVPKSDFSLYSNASKSDATKVDFSNTTANLTKKRLR